MRRLNGQSGMCFQSVCEALATVLSPLCKLQTFTRSPAGLPKYRSHFNNNSFYPQVCLTLSRFKYCTNTKPTDYNSVFELLVFTNNMKNGEIRLPTESMGELWSIITCFWKSHDSDPSINIYMLINILVPRSTYICWFENLCGKQLLWEDFLRNFLKDFLGPARLLENGKTFSGDPKRELKKGVQNIGNP